MLHTTPVDLLRELKSEIVDLDILCGSTENRALRNPLGTKVQGALIRSRLQNIVEMDAPSSFLFGLEKRHGKKKLTEPGQLRKRAIGFHFSLYSSEYEEK